jgi:hypothetical protein
MCVNIYGFIPDFFVGSVLLAFLVFCVVLNVLFVFVLCLVSSVACTSENQYTLYVYLVTL